MRLPKWIVLAALSSPLLASFAPAFVQSGRLPLIEDDYVRARALAIQRKVPLFVDVWAPW